MKLLYIFLCIFISIAIITIIIIKYIKNIWKRNVNAEVGSLKDVIKDIGTFDKQNYEKEKSIGGLTNLLLPTIQEDFPDFNLSNFYGQNKRDISFIMNSLSNGLKEDIENNDDLILIRSFLITKIDDMETSERKETYDNIEVGKSALKSYKKTNGAATIDVSSSVSYYYNSTDKKKRVYDDVKKSSKVNTTYVYVYDEAKFSDNVTHFGLHCPNCGAPLSDLSSTCKYCGIYTEPVNLKAGKISKIEIIE